jgi:hypothetical protein
VSLVVGIDYDSYKATLCAINLEGRWRPRFAEARFRKDRQSGDDEAILAVGQVGARTLGSIADLSADLSSTVVWIERGYGHSRRADWILGAFFGSIYATCAAMPIAAVNPMNAAEWKRLVTSRSGIGVTKKGTGNGNAKKEIANEATRALLILEEIDGAEWTPDQLDAFAVALTGRVLNREAVAA